MDYTEAAKLITGDAAERMARDEMSRAKDDVIQRQADVIETLQRIVKVQNGMIETLQKVQG